MGEYGDNCILQGSKSMRSMQSSAPRRTKITVVELLASGPFGDSLAGMGTAQVFSYSMQRVSKKIMFAPPCIYVSSRSFVANAAFFSIVEHALEA